MGYDAAGDITNDGKNPYLYNADGQICAVEWTYNSITVMTGYIYDAEGNRVAKGAITTMSCDPSANGFTTQADYVLDQAGHQLSEFVPGQGGTMAWQHTNVYAGGELIATDDTTETHYYLNDWLGTRRVQTDYEGTVEQTCASLPYGDGETCAPTPTENLFTGKERDTESGNDYFGARYYASTMGRWMSPDWADKAEPIPYADLTNPQTLNLYGYVGNNPLSRTDPDGHCTNGGQKQGFWWCLFNTSDQDAEQARSRLAMYKNISINGKTPLDAAKGLNNQQTVNLDRSITNFLMDNMLSSKGTQLGLAIATFGAEGLEARVVSGIEAANGTVITGFTEHGVDRAIGDAAAGTPGARAGTRPQAILDAIKNPTKVTSGIDSQGRPYQVFTGKDARVVVNPSSGRIVSVNPLSGAGAH